MTQQQLAEQVGIKFQQIQKYETGANRVSSSWLWDISEVMEVPVNFSLKILRRLMATQRARTIFYKIKKS
jgi:transcriptional regulator with XRE-family HTH domain